MVESEIPNPNPIEPPTAEDAEDCLKSDFLVFFGVSHRLVSSVCGVPPSLADLIIASYFS